jgi:serine/threonine protein kinase
MTAVAPTQPELSEVNLAELGQRLQLALGSRYEVLDPIAIGGMALLYQLQHRLHGGYFVAKVLHPRLSARPDMVASFRAEAVHVAQLSDHPGIVPIFDLAEWDGLFYMVMPYIEGEDLDHLLHRLRTLPRDEALTLVAQISSILAHAQANGIAHCDLAPGNIRLDALGQYRLLDFGLSRSKEMATHSLGGTPAYISPEQIRGEFPDIRSDIYALGIILYEALMGETPFRASTIKELEGKHLRGDWTMPEELHADLPVAALIHRMLATNPEERLSNAFELSGILSALGFSLPEFRSRPTLQISAVAGRRTRKRRLSNQ